VGYNISRKEWIFMKVNIENLVSISEANQNFSKVARIVDENGTVIILKNNVPRYVLIEYGQLEKVKTIDDEEVEEVAKRVLSKHMKAFEELSK
jgi:antitoxin Phd